MKTQRFIDCAYCRQFRVQVLTHIRKIVARTRACTHTHTHTHTHTGTIHTKDRQDSLCDVVREERRWEELEEGLQCTGNGGYIIV